MCTALHFVIIHVAISFFLLLPSHTHTLRCLCTLYTSILVVLLMLLLQSKWLMSYEWVGNGWVLEARTSYTDSRTNYALGTGRNRKYYLDFAVIMLSFLCLILLCWMQRNATEKRVHIFSGGETQCNGSHHKRQLSWQIDRFKCTIKWVDFKIDPLEENMRLNILLTEAQRQKKSQRLRA